MSRTERIRRSAVSGLFYPADVQELTQEVNSLLDRAEKKEMRGKIRGIISPHAGFMYSGSTAAHAYALLEGVEYATVVIVSPSHRDFFNGVSVYPGDAYSTPLGTVRINTRVRDRLLKESNCVIASESGHREEHAIEVQLPFLQRVLPEFLLLPLVIGQQTREVCFDLGQALGEVLKDEDALLVASTDLSHYYPSNVAEQLDSIVIDDVHRFDYDKLMEDLEAGKAEACGGGPVVAVMKALQQMGVKHMEILHHCNSGDVTGDSRSVVGYLSAAAWA